MAFDPVLNPTDFYLLQGRKSPGICKITGAGMPRKWDEIVGYGWSGGFAIYKGQRLAKWKAIHTLATEQDWADWEAFLPLLSRPTSSQRPKALDIWHPWLERFALKSCVVDHVAQPEEDGDLGLWQVTVDYLEFRAPKRALAKPDSSDSKTGEPQSAAEKALGDALNTLADREKTLAE